MTMFKAPALDSAMLDDWINRERVEGRLEAGALRISIGGRTRYGRDFGRHDGGRGVPVSEDSRFWIASMTKPVTSLAAMKLVTQGLLDLAAPVSDFVPGFGSQGVLRPGGGTTHLRRPVTVLDLMRHTAGITYGKFGDEPVHRMYQAADVVDYSASNVEIAARIAGLPLLHQPGTVFEYGMATDLLGEIIEQVAGNHLGQFFHDKIFMPLGMSATGFPPPHEDVVQIPPSDIKRALAPPTDSDLVWESGGAGLFSTATDYMKFARMMMNGGAFEHGRLLDAHVHAAMCRPQLPSGIAFGAYTDSLGPAAPWPKNGLDFGLGLAVRTRTDPTLPGGVGEFFWPGASGSNFWCDPEASLAVVFLNHASDHRVRHRITLRQAVYAALN